MFIGFLLPETDLDLKFITLSRGSIERSVILKSMGKLAHDARQK